jgi:hypothetical protein
MTDMQAQAVANLALWDRLYVTDPKHTKTFSRSGGFKGTAIKPMWAMWRMTKEFGPIGQGWGWTELQHVVESGMIFTQVSVWYVPAPGAEKAWVGPQWGGTEIMQTRRDGPARPDDESFKKSTTDAITKCLSYLGIGGDVHMGQFDDSKYQDEAAAAHAKENKDVDAERRRLWIDGKIALMDAAQNADELKTIHTEAYPRFTKIKAEDAKLAATYEAALARNKDRLGVGKAAAE